MTRRNPSLDAEVTVAAVISRTEMPAVSIAALESGDLLETEPEVGNQPMVRLTVGTSTVALATLAKVDGRLIAPITQNSSDGGQKGDLWKLRKINQPTD